MGARRNEWCHQRNNSSKNGFPWQASMGGPIIQAEYVPEGQSITVNGQTFTGEMYVARRVIALVAT